MIETKITCDHCGNDLTTTGNSIDYRLKLYDEEIPSCGGYVTDMMIYPNLNGAKHFCGMGCLKVWVFDIGNNMKDKKLNAK